MPPWTPYAAGQSFVLAHSEWVLAELSRSQKPHLVQGQKIGKLHYLRFEYVLHAQPATSRVTGTEVIVRLAPSEQQSDATVQERALAACIRALKREAENLLKPRLQTLSQQNELAYVGFAVKQLKRRWGSCDNHQNITLNLFLMELPWEFIDYVLMHELTHTIHMNHGPAFWQQLLRMEPRAKLLSKQLKQRQPIIGAWTPNT